ncbi:MAG: hypothetical protein HGA71_08300 [Azonexaceae bacterium]|nr:hypothetical protein [Azonexaceae bacterium]
MPPKKPKQPEQKATAEQLKALQELFSGAPSTPVAQSEQEQRNALDQLFPGLQQKPLGLRKAEDALQKVTVVQKRHRSLDPLEVEALAQSAVCQSHMQRRAAQRQAEQRAWLAKLRQSSGTALQAEVGRIAKALSVGLYQATYEHWLQK